MGCPFTFYLVLRAARWNKIFQALRRMDYFSRLGLIICAAVQTHQGVHAHFSLLSSVRERDGLYAHDNIVATLSK
jgi:hypothetical protein